MFTEQQLKQLNKINKNERILTKTSDSDIKTISEFIKNNPDKVIKLFPDENN